MPAKDNHQQRKVESNMKHRCLKTALVVECAIRELVDRGLIEMPSGAPATPKAVAEYDQIRAGGFAPDWHFAVAYVRKEYGGDWRFLAKLVFAVWEGAL
jgi:hypothetical protein